MSTVLQSAVRPPYLSHLQGLECAAVGRLYSYSPGCCTIASRPLSLGDPHVRPRARVSGQAPVLKGVTYFLREREPVLSRFTEALETDNVFVSSDVVDYEIRRYLVLKDAKRPLERYEAISRDWLPMSLTRDDWRAAAKLWAELHRAGPPLP